MKKRRYGHRTYGIYQGGHYAGRRGWPRRAVLILLALGLMLFGVLEICIAVGDGDRAAGEPEVMVIFGCQVKPDGPSVLLRDRLDTALAYLEGDPDLPIVVSGGRGKDEPISEAQCMHDYLVEHGVAEERIVMEDRSRNTMENLVFTRQILEELGLGPDILAVSSGFHLTRIRMLADRFGYGEVSTLSAPSSHVPTAVVMFFREPLALVKSFVFDR